MILSLIHPLLLASPIFAQLTLKTNYTGPGFFDLWNYKTGNDAIDLTNQPGNQGNVNFTDQAFAAAQNLTSITDSGNVLIKVDDFTTAQLGGTYGRNAVYLYSKETIQIGSLIVFDAVHIPFGCSVWPALWTRGLDDLWPNQGEIDIIENVNLANHNQFSLHTLEGCTNPNNTSLETGTVVTPNCFINATTQAHNQGCVIAGDTTTFGAGFANVGGGVFATLWDDDGIKMWFFQRSAIPSDLLSGSSTPDPSTWTTPVAFWPQSSCDTTKFFGEQTIIIETDLCGTFAGLPAVLTQTCPSTPNGCVDFIVDPTNYHDAYWEIKYMALFTNSSTTSSSSSTGSSGTSSATSTSSGSPLTTGSSSSNKANPNGAISLHSEWFGAVAGLMASLFLMV